MIRLRFYEEYRDRRIVTNGEMYGIKGELITDCRYVNVVGARAAIDSELGMAKRRRDIDWQRAKAAEYIEREGGDKTFGCDCGWRGRYKDLRKTGAPIFFQCPVCSSRVIFMAVGDMPEDAEGSKKTRRSKKPSSQKNKRTPTRSRGS